MNESKPSLAKIRIEFPGQKWISQIFKKNPDAKLDILNLLPFDVEKSIGNAIIEITDYNVDQIVEEIKNHPSVFEFSILEKEENRVKFNIKTINPHLLSGIIKCGVLVDFPIKVREGCAEWNLLATRKRIDSLLTQLEQKGINFSILHIGNSPYIFDDDKNKLNIEETKILNIAINLGFFEVPRKISLEALATHLGKSKSWISESLRKIIKKKVKFGT